MSNESDYRSAFPYIRTGRIYLDHASTAPYSVHVLDRLQKQMEFRSRGRIEHFPDTLQLLEETRGMVASMINSAPERIAFVQNTSDGLNILAGGIPWKSGDRILLNDIEFPCNVYPFLNQRRHGVEIDFVKNRNHMIEIGDIEAAITPRTRLLSISWVQFLSGSMCNLAEIGALCRRHDIVFCVDAIQGIGSRRIDVVKEGVDFLSCGAQKWLLAPQGIAFVYLTAETQARIRQENAGWLGVKDSWDFLNYRLDFLDTAQRYEGATYNTLGLAGLHGALAFFEQVGWEEVERRVLENATHAFNLLRDRGADLITPADETQRAGIVSFRHDRSEELFQELTEQNIHVSERIGHIRLSPHFYNTTREIDIALNMMSPFLEG